MNTNMEKWFPWTIVGVGLLYLVFFMVPRDDAPDAFPLEDFKSLPVVDGGRTKPLDTVARVNLMVLTGSRQTFTDEAGDSQPAIRWLLDCMSGHLAYTKTMEDGILSSERTFFLPDPVLQKLLLLEPRPRGQYSLADMVVQPGNPKAFKLLLTRMNLLNQKIEERPPGMWKMWEYAYSEFHKENFEKLRDEYDELNLKAYLQAPAAKHKVFRIENEEVLALLGLEPRSRFRYALTEFAGRLKDFYQVAHRAKGLSRADQNLYEAKVVEVAQRLEIYGGLVNGTTPLVIPVPRGTEWFSLAEVWEPAIRESHPFFRMLSSYSEGNVSEFKEALKKSRQDLDRMHPDSKGATGLESFFNHASPFFHLQHLYMLVFLFGCLSWLVWSEPFRKAGLYLGVMTLAVHTLALLARMYISGRPPVTNLYSSAIFIGWGAVLTGVILDFIYRNGIGVAAAGFIGYCTLVIAHFLGLTEDTIGTMQAVLDTNFWLATHVTTVTFGYTATFLAGAIAMIYIILGVFTPLMTPERSQATGKMIYGTVCFAMFLSFVGTVLGGIWADQSWGRFWGWDPKENGALLVVLWNALILHARWGGMVKLRGMACLAVGGNIVTSWSWFGTNMLGVGLHAYGFIPGTVLWMAIFIVSQLMIIGMGLVPLDMWRSHFKARGTAA